MNKYAQIDWTKLKPQPVIGVDEVGRGCLAGPVFAGAVLFLNPSYLETLNLCGLKKKSQKNHLNPQLEAFTCFSRDKQITHYPDSKKISAKERAKLAQIIMNKHLYAIGISSVAEIEKLNILQASLLAMKRATMACYTKWQAFLFQQAQTTPYNSPQAKPHILAHILVDGHFLIPNLPSHLPQTTFVKGDQRLSPIASGSIIAKVARDTWISQQDKQYPHYGFSNHKGYGTLKHRQALAKYGPCPLHRKGFAGVIP